MCISRRLLEARLHTPVYVENNVRAATLAEYNYGNPGVRDSRCLLVVVVDEGVGIGIVLDGRIYPGPRMAAGEFGQMVIMASDSPERYDRPGCLERWLPTWHSATGTRSLSNSKSFSGSGNVTARVRMICHRAMNGEAAAQTAIQDTCKYLGIGISNVVWGLDADTVIIHSVHHRSVAAGGTCDSGSVSRIQSNHHSAKPDSPAVAVRQRSIAGRGCDTAVRPNVFQNPCPTRRWRRAQIESENGARRTALTQCRVAAGSPGFASSTFGATP